jgi:hypothetical protein
MARRHLLSLAAMLACAALTIVAHAVLPAKVDPDLLDGLLVRKLGFPIVAVFYFILLYAHCGLVINLNRTTIRRSRIRSGLLLGSAFALLYMVGMQEIMLDASPFAEWGLDFVAYQSLMGLGDAIPVIILCVAVSVLVGRRGRHEAPVHAGPVTATLTAVLAFTLVMGSSRMLWSYLGVIDSYVLEYAAPVIAWGFALGCVFGVGWLLLERAYVRSAAVMLYGLGLNWVIFNAFMGLVKSGTMLDALTRSLLDVLAMAIAVGLVLTVGRKRATA